MPFIFSSIKKGVFKYFPTPASFFINNDQTTRETMARITDNLQWERRRWFGRHSPTPNACKRFIQISLGIIFLRARNPLDSGMALETMPFPPAVLKSNPAESRYRPKYTHTALNFSTCSPAPGCFRGVNTGLRDPQPVQASASAEQVNKHATEYNWDMEWVTCIRPGLGSPTDEASPTHIQLQTVCTDPQAAARGCSIVRFPFPKEPNLGFLCFSLISWLRQAAVCSIFCTKMLRLGGHQPHDLGKGLTKAPASLPPANGDDRPANPFLVAAWKFSRWIILNTISPPALLLSLTHKVIYILQPSIG